MAVRTSKTKTEGREWTDDKWPFGWKMPHKGI